MIPLVGHYAILSRLVKSAELLERKGNQFSSNEARQNKLLAQIAHPFHGYWHITNDERRDLVDRMVMLIPRLQRSAKPQETLEAILFLIEGDTMRQILTFQRSSSVDSTESTSKPES